MSSFAYDQQLASMPSVIAGVLRKAQAPRLDPARPIVFSGIGTSLHAARVAAEWVSRLSEGAVRPYAVDAHDLGTVAPITPADQVVVISHRGYKLFPNESLRRAHEAGAMTVAIVGEAAPEQPSATHVIRTCRNETAGTFSVSYLASLAVLAAMAAPFETDPDRPFARALEATAGDGALADAVARTLALPLADGLAGRIADAQPLLITGFGGLDLTTAQEAALKIKEGAWLWTEAMPPEFALHGTPASYHAGMGAVVIMPADDDGGRSALLRDRVLRGLGMKVVATCADGPDADLPFAEPPHPLLRPFTAILPFHKLTAELARLRGTDPDTLHGHREPWKTIMTGLRL
ncbi:MAG TPA: SIS domain-containing protein [Arenibaculum sp.]|nr:SIS domain-containing protein [Arenibaculum sp.]